MGPELCAFYDKTWLTQATQKAIFDRYFTMNKTLPQKSTEEIIFRKYIDPTQLYFGGGTSGNTNEYFTGNDTAAGERTFSLVPQNAIDKFVLPEGSSGDSKQSMQYVEQSATIFAIGDWMPETEELNLLHPVYTTTEAVKQMGSLAGSVIDSYYRDTLSNGAGHATDLTGTDITAAGFSAALESMYVGLMLSGAQPVSAVMSSHPNYGTTPVNSKYIAIVHPVAASSLKTGNSDFIPIENYAAGVTPLDNEVGMIGEYRIIQNPNAMLTYVSAGNYSAEVICLGADHSAHIALRGKGRNEVIFHGLGSAGISDPLNRKATVGWKSWLGAKTLYPERLGKITIDVAFA